jgi:tryptophan-rich sensory protein
MQISSDRQSDMVLLDELFVDNTAVVVRLIVFAVQLVSCMVFMVVQSKELGVGVALVLEIKLSSVVVAFVINHSRIPSTLLGTLTDIEKA